MIIKPSRVKLSDTDGSPAFAAVRQPDVKYCVHTEFAFNPQNDGDLAGFVIYLNENFYCRLYKTKEAGQSYIIFERRIDGSDFEIFRREVQEGKIRVEINSDGKTYAFRYLEQNAKDGKPVQAGESSVKFLSTNLAGKCFTGALLGVFAQCSTETDAEMKVYGFGMEVYDI